MPRKAMRRAMAMYEMRMPAHSAMVNVSKPFRAMICSPLVTVHWPAQRGQAGSGQPQLRT